MFSSPFSLGVIWVSECCYWPVICWDDPWSPEPVVGRPIHPSSEAPESRHSSLREAQHFSVVLSASHEAAYMSSFNLCISILGQKLVISWAVPGKQGLGFLCFKLPMILGDPHIKDSLLFSSSSPSHPPLPHHLANLSVGGGGGKGGIMGRRACCVLHLHMPLV